MPATVYLIDASPYIFRAYHSLPSSMTDPSGRPVGAVYGFAAFLIKLLGDERPTHAAVAFDGSLTTSFRNEIYPDYKAQRALPPPELEAQLADCREVAAALGLATFIDERYEADDLLGTLCRRLEAAGHRAVIVSSDKDLAQLVGPRVSLFDFARDRRYGPREVRARFAVAAEQLADLLALAGDSVDNIPGVAGVGAKSAAALLARFSGVEEIYERLEEVPELSVRGAAALRDKLERGRDSARLSKRLATIVTDAPLSAGVGDLELGGARRALVEPLFERLGFDTLRERIPLWANGGEAS